MNKATTNSYSFPITDFDKIKIKMLNWSQQFSIFCLLDNHQYQLEPHNVECLLAVGEKRSFSIGHSSLQQFQYFLDEKPCWLFGHIGYDLKNEIEGLSSSHPDYIGFPELYFFEPEIVIRLSEKEIIIDGDNTETVFREILATEEQANHSSSGININSRFSREEYIAVVEELRKHILRGDCYEINFCQEFFAEQVAINTLFIYQSLSKVSPNPFSAFYKLHERYLICASPERYLSKKGNRILSQPIKGTSKRNSENVLEDSFNRDLLYNSAKDRSENVMVVDLVRNDLAKVCREGSVTVDELYGVYAFPQVYQMISTISGELNEETSFTDILRASFPMGSMTGAPKHNVMKLIEQYEKTRRGIFSGAVGYISPEGDFDFNVVIRSVMYNKTASYLSFQAGSGITFYSDPQKEWEECLLKAEAIRKVLQSI